ncbi:hypothetical protein EEL32_25580 [Brevibacillus laterosporus]|nr:hypothetical protein [Brevibacillus laterosporus]TPG74031.1 hypothetical protein EEL32_25580 [Brevibacillus laterosporus]
MPILRGGVTADNYYTPDIYIEEQELDIPEKPAGVSSKIMGIIGQFQRGSLHEVITVTGEKQFKEKLGGFLEKYPGSKAAFTAFKRGVKKLILVNVRGAGATEAAATLKTTDAKDWVKVIKTGPGLYSNDCLVEVVATNGAHKVLLSHPDIKIEVYDSIKSGEDLVKSINMLSKEYRAELVAEGVPAEVVNQAFEGGSDGSAPIATHYKGSTDSSTGKKTGLELMKTSIEVTDVVTDIFVSDIMNQAMIKAAEDMNWYTYLPTAQGTNVATAITTRNNYDSEFGHLSTGWAKSKDKGWFVPVAVYDCVAHLLSLVQDGTAGFTFKDVESLDVELSADDFESLSKAQVVCMGQMLDNERSLVYGLKSDLLAFLSKYAWIDKGSR